MTGLYTITQVASGRHYIGSSMNVERRMMNHRTLLRSGKHENERLQFSWNKHGESAFDFSALEEVPAETLLSREQAYLDAFFDDLYNLSRVAGVPPNMRGVQHSPAHRANIGAATKRRMAAHPVERNRLADLTRGRPQSVEHRAKISRARTGVSLSAETRAKIARAGVGRKHTEETRAKMRASALGHPVTAETITKIGATRRARGSYKRVA